MKRLLTALATLMLLLPAGAQAIQEDDLLKPEQAFALTRNTIEGDRAILEWTIADGYYLYRSKFRFRSSATGFKLASPQLPDGKIKHDEFFGEVETYRNRVRVEIPFTRDSTAGETLKIEARSQGCADIGVCYPPLTQTAALQLATASPAAASLTAKPPGALANLAESLGLNNDDDLLPSDEAFRFAANVIDGNTLRLDWQIADDYYLYRDKFKLTLENAGDTALTAAQWPAGEVKDDEFFGHIEVYHGGIGIDQGLARTQTGPQDITLVAVYQGCAELRGVCYPPITRRFTLPLPGISDAAAVTQLPASPAATRSLQKPAVTTTEQDRVSQLLAGGSLIRILPAMFLAGLLLAFTACVYPMIPILSSLIVGQGSKATPMRSFTLSLVYVEAVAATYAVIGVLSGMFGAGVQAYFQHPVVLVLFALVFVALALSMFGFYNIQIPAALQSRLTAASGKQKGGTLLGVATMGVLSALIVGPCAGPVLFGAMAYIAEQGDVVLGGLALFALGNGMGAPLLVIGASGGKLLPKAGGWMDTVKAVFGVVLLGVAIVLLERIIPVWVAMLLWALLFVLPAIYLGALEPVPVEATGWRKLWKGTGVAMLIYGVILMLGAASGGNDVLRPLASLSLAAAPTTVGGERQHALRFTRIKSIADFERELAAAKAAGQPVMLDFYADWCTYCIKMENQTFPDAAVQANLADVRLLQADVTANDTQDLALLNHFGLFAPPAILFFGADGVERKNSRLIGFKNAADFNTHVGAALAPAAG